MVPGGKVLATLSQRSWCRAVAREGVEWPLCDASADAAVQALRTGDTGRPRRRSRVPGAARPTPRRARPRPIPGRGPGRREMTSARKSSTSGVIVCRIDEPLDRVARRISSMTRSRAFERVRTRSAVSTTPCSTRMIGLTESSVPMAACAPLMRPPFLRYSSVSRATYHDHVRRPRLERCRRCRRRSGRHRPSRRRSGRGCPRPSRRPASRRRGSRGRAACRARSGRS